MSNDIFPVTKSFLSDRALSREIEASYSLTNVRCQLITATMRDVYMVSANQERYIFYVYRHNQHTLEEVQAEWQFVNYLDAKGAAVAPAVPLNEQDYVISFAAPEGPRYGVLTRFVAGKHLRQYHSSQATNAYGQAIAQIHALADEMPFSISRPVCDIEAILQQSVAAFTAEVPDRSQDAAYLRDCALKILPQISQISREKPYYGIIHGDVIRTNAQVSNEGTVTVLDFDLCGLGWRVYDIASYLFVIRGAPDESEAERAFLSGYEQVRSLAKMERDILSYFEAARAIFSIGVPAMNIYHWGSAYFYAFLDQSMNALRRCMQQID